MELYRITKRKKKSIAPQLKAAAVLAAVVVYAAAYFLKGRPDLIEKYYSAYVSNFFCSALSLVMDVFPFSVAEVLLVAATVGAAVWLVIIAYNIIKNPEREKFLFRTLTTLIAIASMFYAVFQLFWGLNYYRYPLSVNLKLDDKPQITVDELAAASETVIEAINRDIEQIEFEDTKFSKNPMSFFETAYKIGRCYEKASKDYPVLDKMFGGEVAKPIMLSEPMTYTFITGVYTVWTGEANVNVNFPDFIIPDSIAHEMAHSRRIAREDEANFVAFLACSYSDEPYIRYSANLSALIFLSNALYATDKDVYKTVFSKLDRRVGAELDAYSEFLRGYKTKVKDIAQKVNDSYLKSNGQTAGVLSYNQMVKWVVAYLVRKGQ